MRQHPVRRTVSITAAALALLALGTATPAAHAVTSTAYTWVGSSQDPPGDNHSWTDPLNWSPNGVPGDGDSVSIAPPGEDDCSADVDTVPTVTLQDLTLSTGDLCSASINGGAITVLGTLGWDSGTLNSPTTIASAASGTVGATGAVAILGAAMTIAGSVTLIEGTDLRMGPVAQLTVAPGGMLLSSGESFSKISGDICCGPPPTIVNDGTIEVDDALLLMEGITFLQNSRLNLEAGEGDGWLILTEGAATLADGATYDGTGQLWIGDGETATLAGTQHLAQGFSLVLENYGSADGRLVGSGSISGEGQLLWMGGAIAANLTIAHSANMWVQADPNATPLSLSGLDGVTPVTLIDHGNFYTRSSTITMQDQAKLLVAANGHLDMDGGTVMKAASCCTDPDQLVNAGGHVSSFDATLDGVAYVDDGGVTEAAKGGFLSLTGGAPSSLTGTTITGRGRLTIGDPMAVAGTITSRHGQLAVVEGGDLSGEAVVDVTVDNESGLVDPGGPDGSGNVGTLTVGGRFTQRSAGTLHLDLSSTGSDQLVVVGVATLAGTVVANNLSGYAPTRGESRTVVTSAGVTWKVTCVVTGGQGSKHGHWQPVAGETDLGLTWRRGSQTSC